jgi:murein DD-endopeptidase MepM/ murein hydrolase activator NlpD
MSSDPMKKLMVKNPSGKPNYQLPGKRRVRGRHIFLLLLMGAVLFGIYEKVYLQRDPPILPISEAPVNLPVPPVPTLPEEVISPPAQKAEVPDKFEIRHEVARSGETFEQVLERSDISIDYVSQWEKACKPVSISRIKENDELIFFVSRVDNQPVKIIYSPYDGPPYTLRKVMDGWDCQFQDSAAKGPVRTVQATYSENLYDSCIAGGLPAALVTNLADMFAYDIDFTSDLKDGDAFAVLFQEQDLGGEDGKQFLILAAEMSVSGKPFRAIGFQLPDGSWDYFDEKGASLKRAFLRTPLSYKRLLSPSAYKNTKPVLKIYRPHLGIDYAAPRGTPVSAIGDGVIFAVNKSGGKSLSIEVRHRGGYRSLYGHLSAVSRGLKRGTLVSQGEVIGSIGPNGSGKPFLDFHFYKDSKAVNFHTMEFPRAKTIPKGMRAEFEKTRDSSLAALQGKTPQRQEVLSGRE